MLPEIGNHSECPKILSFTIFDSRSGPNAPALWGDFMDRILTANQEEVEIVAEIVSVVMRRGDPLPLSSSSRFTIPAVLDSIQS